MSELRVNEGYYIIASVPVEENMEIVIGQNSYGNYVVWHCKNKDDYFWGRYVNTYKRALDMLCEKIKLEIR